MSSFKTLLGGRAHFIQISIPNNTGLPASVYNILKDAGIVNPIYVEIDGFMADGTTQRPAFQIATPRPGTMTIASNDFTVHAKTKSLGEPFIFPPTTNFDCIYIRSITSSAILAQFLVIEGL